MTGRFKYVNPEILNPGAPVQYTTPVQKAIGVTAPTGEPGTIPPINTIDDALSFSAQVKAFPDLVKEAVIQEKVYGRPPKEIMNEVFNRDDRGILGKSFDYLTKPFRYETSVFTSPVVAAIEAASKSRDLGDFVSQYARIAPELERQALTNEREVSVYDALNKLGLSNWISLPVGLAADILLSPSTYLGIGGLTRLGRAAEVATRASRTGRAIDATSKLGQELAELSGSLGPDALKLAPTMAEQAELGQRALIKFMGKPIVKGAPVFERVSGLRDLTLGTPTMSKAFGTRPATVDVETWNLLKDIDRERKGAIGLESKGITEEIKDWANSSGLSEDELKEVFYALARSHAPADRVPWDKLTYQELRGSPVFTKTRLSNKNKFIELAEAQRGLPEMAMLRAQRATGGGVMPVTLEHTGDLLHRMNELPTFSSAGYEYVKEKVNRVLTYLERPYGFEKEFLGNLKNNGKTLEEVKPYLQSYADSFKNLPTYNRAQKLAQEAAISLGEGRYDDSIKALKEIKAHLGSRDEWVSFAREGLTSSKMKMAESEGASALDALRAKYPGLFPDVQTVSKKEFSKLAKKYKIKNPGDSFTIGDPLTETTTYISRDAALSPKSWETFEAGTQAVEEGKNIFSVLPTHYADRLAKVYGSEKLTPDLAEQFGKDWSLFSSGQDRFLSGPFKNWVKGFSESPTGWKKVPGIFEVELPSGDVKRIVGDLKFLNQEQEAVRVYAKTKFQELLDSEKSLGVLNKSVEDYVPMIYDTPIKKFSFRKSGKEISTTPFFTKERKFQNIEEAEKFGHRVVENPLELIGIRSMKSVEAIEGKKMLDKATELFGIVNDGNKMSMRDWKLLGKAGINPENKREVAEYLTRNGYQGMKIGDQEVFFQPEIQQYLTRLAEPFVNDESMKSFLRTYDRALNVWKGYVTAINPKFHARNFISNVFLLYLKDGLRGLDLRNHWHAMNMALGKPGEIFTEAGTRYSYDDVMRLMNEHGVLGSGFMGGELKSAFRSHLKEITQGKELSVALNPLRSRNIAIETGRKFGTNVENEAKIVGFVNDLIKTDDPALAARRTFEHLYDYMDLTHFEKNVAKRLIPFYTWMSKNIPLMLKKMIMEPGKIAGPMAKLPMVYEHKTTADLIGRGIQYPPETVPSFIREQGAFPVGVDEKGRVKYYIPGLPYMDIARLSPNELLSSVTPIAKPFTEWLPKGGYSIFMDRPYETYAGQMVEAPLGTSTLPKFIQDWLGAREEKYGTYMPGKTAAIINTLLPMLRTPQKLHRAMTTPGEGQYIYPSEIIGQKFIPVDPATERKATMYEWLKNIEEGKKVEKGIERREGKRAVEKGGPLSLEELLKIHSLRYGPNRTILK